MFVFVLSAPVVLFVPFLQGEPADVALIDDGPQMFLSHARSVRAEVDDRPGRSRKSLVKEDFVLPCARVLLHSHLCAVILVRSLGSVYRF